MSQNQKIIRYNRPANRGRMPSVQEIWAHRYMIVQLIRRDFKARYMQSVLGVLWIIIAPLMTMLVFTFIFDRLADVPSYSIPYPVFSFAALVPWGYFSRAVSVGSSSIVVNRQLVTDVYIPRIIIPIITQLTGLIDMLINFIVFLLLLLLFGILPSVNSIFLIFFIIQIFLLTTGISLLLSSLQVRFRDIGSLVGYAIQLLVFLSPVAYPSNIVEGRLEWLYSLNPLVGILDGWRWAVLGIDTVNLSTIGLSWITTALLLGIGLFVFTKSETTFVDWI